MDTNLREQLEALHVASFLWALSCTGGDRTEAEDVLQTAYVEVLEGRAQFSQRSSLRTWLFAVIRNIARSRARRRHYRRLLLLEWQPETQPQQGADEHLERDEQRARLRLAIDKLSARQREVLELVFYHDSTLEETAEILDMSLGTARTHYHRGKAQLLKHLTTQEEPWAPLMTKN
jgi:RNA polymerase sigma factor (sigma-70 family)